MASTRTWILDNAQRIIILPRISRKGCRSFATGPYPPSSKLAAFPFKITPEEARNKMRTFNSPNIGFFSTILNILKDEEPDPHEVFIPDRFVALYYPTWTIWTSLSGYIHAPGPLQDEPQLAPGACRFQGTTLPGSSYAPLCLTSISIDADPRPIPFQSDLLNQQGMEVTCLPYDISPFFLERHDFSTQPVQLAADISLTENPTTNFFAAYPVLVPVYLAERTRLKEYEKVVPGEENELIHEEVVETQWMEAIPGGKHYRTVVSSDDSHNVYDDETGLPTVQEGPSNEVITLNSFRNSAPQLKFFVDGYTRTPYVNAVESYVRRERLDSTVFKNLAAAVGKEGSPTIGKIMKDPRVRQWNETELAEMKTLFRHLGILKDFEVVYELQRMLGDLGVPILVIGNQKPLDVLRENVEKLTPKWWTDYVSKNGKQKK